MINIELAALANDLILEKNYKIEIKYEIVKGMLEAAVAFINEKDDERRDEIFNNVLSFGTYEYPMNEPDQVLGYYVQLVKRRIKQAGWDKRLVLTASFSNSTYRTATIGMDLEATAARLGWLEEDTVPEVKESIMDVVSETPTMDELNEFNTRSNVKRSEPRALLYTSRRPVFVQPDKRRNG